MAPSWYTKKIISRLAENLYSHEDIMIGQGWFVRKHTTDFTKALEVLESKTKGGRD